eukprot:m.67472 g.67472  ORF g.67472 m.67472 type:complete len:535 (+) comp7682_c0_seq2:1124-2728(+)
MLALVAHNGDNDGCLLEANTILGRLKGLERVVDEKVALVGPRVGVLAPLKMLADRGIVAVVRAPDGFGHGRANVHRRCSRVVLVRCAGLARVIVCEKGSVLVHGLHSNRHAWRSRLCLGICSRVGGAGHHVVEAHRIVGRHPKRLGVSRALGVFHDVAQAQNPRKARKGNLVLLEVGLVHSQAGLRHARERAPHRDKAHGGMCDLARRVENGQHLVLVHARVPFPVEIAAREELGILRAAAPDGKHGAKAAKGLLGRLALGEAVRSRGVELAQQHKDKVLEIAWCVGEHNDTLNHLANVVDSSSSAACLQALQLLEILAWDLRAKEVAPLPVERSADERSHLGLVPLAPNKTLEEDVVDLRQLMCKHLAVVIAHFVARSVQIGDIHGCPIHGIAAQRGRVQGAPVALAEHLVPRRNFNRWIDGGAATGGQHRKHQNSSRTSTKHVGFWFVSRRRGSSTTAVWEYLQPSLQRATCRGRAEVRNSQEVQVRSTHSRPCLRALRKLGCPRALARQMPPDPRCLDSRRQTHRAACSSA